MFKLGGTAKLPPPPPKVSIPRPPPLRAPEAQVARGRELFGANCSKCHGENAIGGVKDLRFMTAETHAQFADIVLKGIRADKGMASFAGQLSPEDVEAIHAFLIARGRGWPRIIFPGFTDMRGYEAMYRDFYRAIREGAQPEMSLERAMEDQVLMDRVYAS